MLKRRLDLHVALKERCGRRTGARQGRRSTDRRLRGIGGAMILGDLVDMS